ncbi:MAG: ABC transporter substrate-binding protein [Myxococcota bacterium]|nr:ABC transporter substrate-binding protein [Myxococcota bacterium]
MTERAHPDRLPLRHLRTLLVAALLPAVALAAPDETAAAPEPASHARGAPTAVVESLHELLLGTMQEADELGFEGRRDKLAPLLSEVWNFRFVAQKSVGRTWRTLDEPGRERLTDTLERLAIATYAARFDGFGGERFETLGEETATHGTVLVRTRIVQADGEIVPLDYRLLPDDNGSWHIVDVFLNGTVSELAMRRSQYATIIKRDGVDGLFSALEDKIAAQATGGSDES